MSSFLVYYPFQLATNPQSGSQLRPLEMLQAFERYAQSANKKMLIISGTSSERMAQWEKLVKEDGLEDIEFCYSENQTIPLWLTDPSHIPTKPFIDKSVFKELKRRNIPIGVFYRDVYWKFDDLYPVKGLKKVALQTIYRLEEKFYQKYVSTVFLPSQAMSRYVSIATNHVPLPPGGRRVELPERKTQISHPQGIYVGGINSEDYGVETLLEAVKELKQEGTQFELHIACREDEFERAKAKRPNVFHENYATFYHKNASELEQVYAEMDMAFIPRKKTVYNDFSVPVKLVEYLSSGIPVVASDCDAQREIIEQGGYGVIVQDDKEGMKQGIREMIQSSAAIKLKIQSDFLQNHSWDARVHKVVTTLVGGNS